MTTTLGAHDGIIFNMACTFYHVAGNARVEHADANTGEGENNLRPIRKSCNRLCKKDWAILPSACVVHVIRPPCVLGSSRNSPAGTHDSKHPEPRSRCACGPTASRALGRASVRATATCDSPPVSADGAILGSPMAAQSPGDYRVPFSVCVLFFFTVFSFA